jgi:L-amino acid N-acyltransferase YncA
MIEPEALVRPGDVMIKDYPKAIVTKDGASVLLRPATKSDEEALNKFFSEIPEEEQWFLREELTDPELLRRWLDKVDYDQILPIVAVREDDGQIIANLRLYRSQYKSLRHLGHIRIMVSPAYRHLKVGSWMILDSIKLAMDLGMEKVVAEFIAGKEEPAINAARKMDFHQEAILKDYVKDREGNNRDLIIMVRNLHREWGDF